MDNKCLLLPLLAAGLAALPASPALAAGVPADSTLPACYPQAAVEAVFSQKPPELAAALEAALPEMKNIGRGGGLALADYYLLTAHTLSQVPGKAASAAGYYKAAADLLGSSDFLVKGLDPVALAKGNIKPEQTFIELLWKEWHAAKDEDKQLENMDAYMKAVDRQKKNGVALPKLETAVSRMKIWPKLRQAWAYYGELGLFGGDAESQKKGEALLAAMGDPALAEQRPWLLPAGSVPRQAGPAQAALEPWHPNQTDKKLSYELPFLYKTQTFRLTVKNGGAEPLEFSSDDIVLSSAGAAGLAAMPVGDLTPDVLANGMNLQQFFFPELTPYTFSDQSAKEYGDKQLEVNPEMASQMNDAEWQRKSDEAVARAERRRAERAASWAKTFNAINTNMLNSINAMDARQDSQRASEARSAGSYKTAAMYENRARWAQDSIKYNEESRKSWDAAMDAEAAKAGQVKTSAGSVPVISPAAWENSLSDRLTRLEAKITLRLASKKLERFLNSDFVLPHKATNLRLPPGESWTGLVSFNTREGGYGSLRLTLHQGGAARQLSFPLRERLTWVVKPPYLFYRQPQLVINSRDFGPTNVPMHVDWNVLLPDFAYQY